MGLAVMIANNCLSISIIRLKTREITEVLKVDKEDGG